MNCNELTSIHSNDFLYSRLVVDNLARYSRDLHRLEDYNETLKSTMRFCGDECDDRVLPLPLPECFGNNGRNIERNGCYFIMHRLWSIGYAA